MKKLAVVAGIAVLLSACSTAQTNYAQNQQAVYTQQISNMQSAVDKAPDWMSRLPKSPNAVYENGTATSSDFGMADMKAKTIAYAKICIAAGGKVRSQMKMAKIDNDSASSENSELTVRSICPDIDITGVETVEMRHVSEGNRIRTYALVALPIGTTNVLKGTKDAQKRVPEAFEELDRVAADPANKPASTPALAAPVASPQSSVSGVTTINLLPVDNEAYKAQRDAALQKPGAVIGQTTLR